MQTASRYDLIAESVHLEREPFLKLMYYGSNSFKAFREHGRRLSLCLKFGSLEVAATRRSFSRKVIPRTKGVLAVV